MITRQINIVIKNKDNNHKPLKIYKNIMNWWLIQQINPKSYRNVSLISINLISNRFNNLYQPFHYKIFNLFSIMLKKVNKQFKTWWKINKNVKEFDKLNVRMLKIWNHKRKKNKFINKIIIKVVIISDDRFNFSNLFLFIYL